MTDKKTHWKKTFNKDFLGAWDLEEGEELKLIISHVDVQKVKNPQGEEGLCNVAHFTDKKVKPMILNVGACKLIQRFTGSKYIEEWGGCAIQVYVQEGVRAFGEITDALRIREFQPRMTKEALTPDHKKWSGAVSSYAKNGDLAIITKYYELSPENEQRLKDEAAALPDSAEQ